MENTAPVLCAPRSANVTVRRPKGPRDYLTEREIEKLMDAASKNRWGHRDATAILIAYRHGLRASELVSLRWDDIDFATGKLHVRRAKGVKPTFILSAARSCVPCVGYSAKRPKAPTCSCPSASRP